MKALKEDMLQIANRENLRRRHPALYIQLIEIEKATATNDGNFKKINLSKSEN